MKVGVVDYGAGNLVSVGQALTHIGATVVIVRDARPFDEIDALVVPGVGAARPAMRRLRRFGLLAPIRAWLDDDRPYLGICLGLQLLFEGSDEDGAETLGVLRGRTTRLEDTPTLPHIGWNQIERDHDHPLFDGIDDGADVYFVHSYAGAPRDPHVIVAQTTHGRRFVSAIARGRTFGVQFHPERSGRDGLRLLANFVSIAREADATARASAQSVEVAL
ncbi:MAG TPA: imidazole glycerol phosphate synthase subunit HisH [Candidatus Limnocylindrales bacterium]|nr:imidazole glycerol phosphate synthase subunit HisH [Candidatus Limnocylindrales bacterium]